MLQKVRDILFGAQVLPVILTLFIVAILFVLFRMKGVEFDYKTSDIDRDISKASLQNKELKAKKAKLLSIKQLRRFAAKYELASPQQEQIIIIK